MKTIWPLISLTFRRLYSRPGLTLLALLGIVLAVGLLSSTAFFTQAVDRVILNQELDALSRVTGRIPFSTRVYFLPSTRVPVGMTEAESVGRSVAGSLSQEIGLPIEHFGVHIESKGMMLLAKEGDTRYGDDKSFLGTIALGHISGIESHIEAVTGEPFNAEMVSANDEIAVWMHAAIAAEMGINVGETFDVALNISQKRNPVRIAGLWQSTEPTERFWFNNPDSNLRDVLLVSRADYVAHVEPILSSKSGLVAWHIILDEQRLNPADARQYAEGFELGMQVVEQYFPGARLDVSALDPLKDFVQRQTTLTTILLGFNVPALGFLIAFLILISVIIAEWQRRETAIMVSRGMSLQMVLGLVLLEEVLLFVVGLPLGVALGMGIARFMGNTVSFLAFENRPGFPVSLQGANLNLIILALGFSLLARLAPALMASRQSVVVQAQERARPIRAPFWQRMYIDFILILPTYYIYQQLAKRGSLAKLVDENPDEIFQDPLLILLPALFVLTTALLSMRLFPLIMRLFDMAASRMPFLTMHLALRQLGRYTQGYMNPLLLVIISLALGIYTYSLAASLDQWLVDRVYFQAAADVSFLPSRDATGGNASNSSSASSSDEPAGSAGWIPPKDEYGKIDGVIQAGRMGRYPASIPGSLDGEVRGQFLGIDRIDFPQVAWYRKDFAPESLGALMNRLATAPDNILVSEEYLHLTGRRIGDKIAIEIKLEDGIEVRSEFTISGLYTYFPTVNTSLAGGSRNERPATTVIGNLEHLFFLGGAQYPHRILMRTIPDEARTPQNLAAHGGESTTLARPALEVPVEDIRSESKEDQPPTLFALVEELGFDAVQRRHAINLISEEQAKFERVGIFGTLSVGFLAASLMAILALLVYSNASLQERLYQFGIMRAVGLMHGQLLGQVILEYSILIAYGAVIGLLIGAATSALFVPFFRIAAGQNAPLPPLIPVIAQEQIVPLTLSFALAMVLVITLLIVRAMRGRLFDALRIGHQG